MAIWDAENSTADRGRGRRHGGRADAGVGMMMIPAVQVGTVERVPETRAPGTGSVLALGSHPLYVARRGTNHLEPLAEQSENRAGRIRIFVGIGANFGLDFEDRGAGTTGGPGGISTQAQLRLARSWSMPVVLMWRRWGAERLLKLTCAGRVKGDWRHSRSIQWLRAAAREFVVARDLRLGFGALPP